MKIGLLCVVLCMGMLCIFSKYYKLVRVYCKLQYGETGSWFKSNAKISKSRRKNKKQ